MRPFQTLPADPFGVGRRDCFLGLGPRPPVNSHEGPYQGHLLAVAGDVRPPRVMAVCPRSLAGVVAVEPNHDLGGVVVTRHLRQGHVGLEAAVPP